MQSRRGAEEYARQVRAALDLRLYLHPALDELPLDAITGEVVARMMAGLADRGISPKTRCNVRATLRRILASAVEWGVIEKLPDLPTVTVPAREFDFLLHHEAERLVAVARSDEERALLLFALNTGARAGEQLAVEVARSGPQSANREPAPFGHAGHHRTDEDMARANGSLVVGADLGAARDRARP